MNLDKLLIASGAMVPGKQINVQGLLQPQAGVPSAHWAAALPNVPAPL